MICTKQGSPFTRPIQSFSCIRSAEPRLIQWLCGRSVGITIVQTKLLECPVVARTPLRAEVL